MRRACCALAALLLLAGANLAQAEEHWWNCFWRDYHRNNCWPQPFVHIDRGAALMPWAVMEANGWQRQNLLGDHHFTPDSTALSPAGKLKLDWILTQAPAQRRMIFVERNIDPNITAARVQVLQRSASDMLPAGQVVAIHESKMKTEGWPAADVDRTNVQFMESRPTPALPAATQSGTD